MDLPIKNGGSFHSYVNVYQRVFHGESYGFRFRFSGQSIDFHWSNAAQLQSFCWKLTWLKSRSLAVGNWGGFHPKMVGCPKRIGEFPMNNRDGEATSVQLTYKYTYIYILIYIAYIYIYIYIIYIYIYYNISNANITEHSHHQNNSIDQHTREMATPSANGPTLVPVHLSSKVTCSDFSWVFKRNFRLRTLGCAMDAPLP